jgi:hypothetical protein
VVWFIVLPFQEAQFAELFKAFRFGTGGDSEDRAFVRAGSNSQWSGLPGFRQLQRITLIPGNQPL